MEPLGEDDIPEREVSVLLADFASVWDELLPAEQARIVELPVERVDMREDALEVRIRATGSPASSAYRPMRMLPLTELPR